MAITSKVYDLFDLLEKYKTECEQLERASKLNLENRYIKGKYHMMRDILDDINHIFNH